MRYKTVERVHKCQKTLHIYKNNKTKIKEKTMLYDNTQGATLILREQIHYHWNGKTNSQTKIQHVNCVKNKKKYFNTSYWNVKH